MKKWNQRLLVVMSAMLIVGLSIVFSKGMYSATQKLPVKQYFPGVQDNAVWDWTNPLNHRAGELDETGTFLYRHQIKTVYLDVSGVLQPDGEAKLTHAVEEYILAMNKHGIQVFAAGGDKNWSKPTERYLPLAIESFVYSFNQSHPSSRFAGVEFDIEAYNQDGFADANFSEKSRVLTEYLDAVDVLATQHQQYLSDHPGADLELGFSVPYWFDNENQNIKSVTWLNKTGPAIYHLMDRLNQLPKSNVVVMAYRNAARGNDGTIVHMRTEIEYAQYKANGVKVLVGQETTNVEPTKITFYGRSTTELAREMKWVNDEFGKSGVLGGIAINDLAGFRALSDD